MNIFTSIRHTGLFLLLSSAVLTGCADTTPTEPHHNVSATHASHTGTPSARNLHHTPHVSITYDLTLPTPLPTTDPPTRANMDPVGKPGNCERNNNGLLAPNQDNREITPTTPAYKKAVLTGNMAALKKIINTNPNIAKAPENSWAVSYALTHGCFNMADYLVQSGAKVFNTTASQAGDVFDGRANIMELLTHNGNTQRIITYLDAALTQETNDTGNWDDIPYDNVWDSVIENLCATPASAWPELKKRGIPLWEDPYMGKHGDFHTNYAYEYPKWLELLTCENKGIIRTIWADAGDARPEEALATLIDTHCVFHHENHLPMYNDGPQYADAVWTLRDLGYRIDEKVNYPNENGTIVNGSVQDIVANRVCSHEVDQAIGRTVTVLPRPSE